MNYEEAKAYAATGRKVWMARVDGSVWSAGQMVDVGEVISYHATKAEAVKACKDYELVDFDRKHLYTSAELCDEMEFAD